MCAHSRIISHSRAFFHFPKHPPRARVRFPSLHSWSTPASVSTMSVTKGDGAKIRRPTYNTISDVESLEDYVPGGYHPIMIGDMLYGGKYRIVGKLGFGGYSTVWLAQETQAKCYVAVKVGTTNSPSREVNILRQLRRQFQASAAVPFPACQGRNSIAYALDEFQVEGPKGTHPCYTMPVAACDLRTASYSELFSVDVARALSGRLVLAVAYLHARGYAHGVRYSKPISISVASRKYTTNCISSSLRYPPSEHPNLSTVSLKSAFDRLAIRGVRRTRPGSSHEN